MSDAYQVEYTFAVETGGDTVKFRAARMGDIIQVVASVGHGVREDFANRGRGFQWMTILEQDQRPDWTSDVEKYLDANPLPMVPT